MVSVIIPVYNVEEYLDECLASVVQQSFQDIEVLLINDGSTDGSGEKCLEWEKKDSRIVYIDKKNEGQAACRNLGVQIAKGEYLTFVDSDDWVDPRMIELLYQAIVAAEADLSMCEAHIQHSDGRFTRSSLQCLEDPVVDISQNPEFILTVRYTMWSKLYRKSLFEIHEIVEPSIKFEDFAIIPIICALSKRIACVNQQLYYYRYRLSGTVWNPNFIFDRFTAVECLIHNFQKRNMVEEWSEILKRLFYERVSALMSPINPILNKEYDSLQKRYYAICNGNEKAGEERNQKQPAENLFQRKELAVIGSYNLMMVAKMVMNIWTADFLHNHVCFSSIVSMVSESEESFYDIDLMHDSPFRRKHLIQDFTKCLAQKHKCEFADVDYVLLDFLEERFDVGEVNGNFFTISEAFQEIEERMEYPYHRVDKFSDTAKKRWKNCCDKFIELLSRFFTPNQVILVKMYLTEGYGAETGENSYSNVSEIRKVNCLLKEYYDYFQRKMPQIKVIEPLKQEDWFTDQDFRHGCFPWHINERAFHILKCKVNELIKEDSQKHFGDTL